MKARVMLTVILALLSLRLSADEDPRLERIGGIIALQLPGSLLEKSVIRERFGSGLTTTFLVEARAGGRRQDARIEVRYDLWDEVYLARSVDSRGRSEVARLRDLPALAGWWKDHPLRLYPAAEIARGRVAIELRVLPFSASEEEDTRSWVGEAAGLSSRGDPESVGPRAGQEIVDTLISTSIRVRPILTYRWTVPYKP